MENLENNQHQNNEGPIDMSKMSPEFKAYIEARDALFAKYGKAPPALPVAA